MIKYRIVIMKPARKFIEKQPQHNQTRLLKAIYRLPIEGDIKRLVGQENVYRLRVGDFRVIYTLYNDVLTVEILDVGNRGDVYN